MNFVVWIAVAMVGSCATAMAAWIWFTAISMKEELRLFAGFEALHLEA